MKKSFVLLSAGLLAASTLFQSCKGGSGDAVTLKMNFPTGTQYSYLMDTKTNMEIQGMNTDQTMTMESTYDVQAGDGTDKKIAISYDRIAMSMKSPMGNMDYDSKNASKDSVANPFSMMLNKKFNMTVGENGEIKKIDGLNEIVNSVGNEADPQTAAIRKQMQESFSDTTMRNMMAQSFNFYPDKAVKTGDTWAKQMNIAIGPIAMKVDNTYKLTGVTNGTAHLDVTSKISSNGGSMSAGGQDVKMDLNGDAKGTMDVDVATGFLTDSKMKQNITGSMGAAGMTVPMKMVIDIHMSGKKK